jgi:hypothetical protein
VRTRKGRTVSHAFLKQLTRWGPGLALRPVPPRTRMTVHLASSCADIATICCPANLPPSYHPSLRLIVSPRFPTYKSRRAHLAAPRHMSMNTTPLLLGSPFHSASYCYRTLSPATILVQTVFFAYDVCRRSFHPLRPPPSAQSALASSMLPSQLETIVANDCQRQRKQGKCSSRLLITVLPCVPLFF